MLDTSKLIQIELDRCSLEERTREVLHVPEMPRLVGQRKCQSKQEILLHLENKVSAQAVELILTSAKLILSPSLMRTSNVRYYLHICKVTNVGNIHM